MEEVDVAVIGAGVAGLAAALALLRVNPALRVKVLDSRPSPTSTPYAGFITLAPNGRKAAAAISPKLAAALDQASLPERRTLLHGEDGHLIVHLDRPNELVGSPEEDVVMERGQQGSSSNSARGGSSRSSGIRGGGGAGGGSSSSSSTADLASNRVIGWWELERLLLDLLPDHTVEYECNMLKYSETPGAVVAIFEGLAYPLHARILLGADGPFSIVRSLCVQDSDPAFDSTVKWTGRLPGHQTSTTPQDYCAWFMRKGQVFISHPLCNGDVAWEALVTEKELQGKGLEYDESSGRVLPAGAPRGQKQKQAAGGPEGVSPVETLSQLFQGWPRAVCQMINFAAPDAVLESGVYIRSPAEMPPSLGKGRVELVGEAAHPLRPTGQDSNLALEDAADLAAFVQEYGLTKEALRRYDITRRPRWRHVMQLTLAQGASTTTGVALSRSFLDYTTDLYKRDFTPLGPMGRAQGGRPRLASLYRGTLHALLAAGVLTVATLVGSGIVVAPAEGRAGAEEGPAAGWLGRARRVLGRGRRRVQESIRAARKRARETKPAQAISTQFDAAKEYAERRAEGFVDTAIDSGSSVAKQSLHHRIARWLGVF